MKTVYFVRHGESEGNVGSVFQRADSPLTTNGKKQAALIAERCARLLIEVIISSTQPRAEETTRLIAEKTGHRVELLELFRERKKPSSLEGKPHNDPVAQKLNEAWWKSLAGIGPRVEDGENSDDIKRRAGEALSYLEERREKDILVVTHGFFLRFIVAWALCGEGLSPVQFEPFIHGFRAQNTGITVLKQGASHPEALPSRTPWILWTWNDHAHLG